MLTNEKEPRYRGDIVNCTRHGKGTYKYSLGGRDMISYVGTWKYGAKHGPGAKFNVSGFAEYVGDFKGAYISAIKYRLMFIVCFRYS